MTDIDIDKVCDSLKKVSNLFDLFLDVVKMTIVEIKILFNEIKYRFRLYLLSVNRKNVFSDIIAYCGSVIAFYIEYKITRSVLYYEKRRLIYL